MPYSNLHILNFGEKNIGMNIFITIQYLKHFYLMPLNVRVSSVVSPHSFIPPSHRRRGATGVLVRHEPQWHRHDRRGSAVVPSLIAVAPPKLPKPRTFAVARRKRLTCSAVRPQYYPRHTEGAVSLRCLYDTNRSGTAMITVVPQWFRH